MADGSNPTVMTDNTTGDLIIDQRVPAPPVAAPGSDHFENLVARAEASALDAISASLTTRIAEDERGQSAFVDLMAEQTKLLGVGPESEPDDLAYENSDTSDSQLMITALTRFMSKATAAIMPQPKKVCRAEHNVDLTEIEDLRVRQKEKTRLTAVEGRVEDFYTDYLFYKDQPYQEDTDQIIRECGLHGMGIRKIYNDFSRPRNKTRLEWVPIQNMIFSYDARSFTVGRIAQKIDIDTSDLIRRVQSGEYVADNIVAEASANLNDDALTEEQDRIAGLTPSTGVGSTHRIYEVYTDLFLDADPHPLGLARPYVVTIHSSSQQIISIKRNWQPNDPEETRIETYVGYIYFPGKSAVQGWGLGHLLANVTRALRKGQRRGLDAAYLQNAPFGYKLSNMSIREGSSKIIPGEFIDVDSPTDDIRSAIQMNMFQGPSQGLMALMDRLEGNGKELGGIATMDFAQLMRSGVSVAPALAALEESSEFQTSIHRRLYDAQQAEMKLLHDRMLEVHGGHPVPFGDGKFLRPGDLTSVDLVPMMKPGFVSKQKSIIEAQALVEAAERSPDLIDRRKANEEYIRAIGRADIDDFIKPDESENPPQPADPVTEYMSILQNRPVAAGLSQNHQAHIDAHNAQMRMIETSGMPVRDGEAAMASLAAHIVDHHAKMMLADISARIGIPPEAFAQGIPPEMEGKVAMAIAQATQAVEAERRPPEAESESKIAIEQVKGQIRAAETTMKQRHDREMADLKHRQALELQAQKDDAETERHQMDDDMARDIAQMKMDGTAGPEARPKAGVMGG